MEDLGIYNITYKTILTFMEIDEFDVLFFSMEVAVYKSHTPGRNQIMIVMVDSISFLQPSKLRRMIFQEVIWGYFHNARERG